MKIMTNRTSQLRILAVTNMLPTPDDPHSGRFIEQQIKTLRRMGMEVEILLVNRKAGIGAYFSLPAMLREAMVRFQPDLVHVMYGGIMAWIIPHVVRDRPVMVTFHGSDLLGQPFERPLRRFLSACGVLASKQGARLCSGIVAVAEHLVERLPKSVSVSRVEVIPCGIDMDIFRPLDRVSCRKQLGWTEDTFHVLFQVTGDPVKRPELAAAAMERLKELGVKAELHYLRGIEYERVPIWINGSDVLLLTSRHEGSPTIVKEALACNLPIVSVGVGDVPKRIGELKGCYLSSADPTELALSLQAVRIHPVEIAGRAAASSVSTESCTQRLIEFYARVLRSWD